MPEHVHEWRFAPNIERVSDARTNTYGFYCVVNEECQEYILLPDAERRLNATDRLSAEDAMYLRHNLGAIMLAEPDKVHKHDEVALRSAEAYAAAMESAWRSTTVLTTES